MALTVTNVSPATSTVDASSYALVSFTPVAGDLIVVMIMAAGTVDPAPTLASDANGITFSRLTPMPAKQGNSTGKDSIFCFVADQLVPASPVAMVCTLTLPTDGAQGIVPMVARLAGALQAGTAAIRQAAGSSDGVNGTTPSITFASAPLTTNAVLFVNAYTTTAPLNPTGFTTRRNTAIATPTAGGGYHSANSGITSTTIASPTSAAGAWAATGIEIDASAGGGGGPAPFEGWGVPL